MYAAPIAALLSLSFAAGCSHGPAPASTETPTATATQTHAFSLRYAVTIPAPQGPGSVDLFVPIATSDARQVVSHTVDASVEGVTTREDVYGNLFWHARIEDRSVFPVTVNVDYRVARQAVTAHQLGGDAMTQTEVNARFLGSNNRVPIAGSLVDQIRKDLPPHADDPLSKARAIYDYVLANMTYKKVGTGWGNGDTYWACSEKYGNCTDFHALFISLARAEGIPARFEIGLPVPMDRARGTIGGYHCWVEFYIEGRGWLPVDASEASKDPTRREAFFGAQPPDRLRITTGRDLSLGAAHRSGALNYFVYPHLEVGGEASKDYAVEFSYVAR